MKPFRRQFSPRIIFLSISILALGLLFWPARELRSDNFVFYLPSTRHVMALTVIENAKYLPLLQVLNQVGKVSGLQEKRDTLRVWFGASQLEFHQNETKVRVDRATLKLSDPVRTADGQWMVPLDFLTIVLPQLTKEPIEYQVGMNRVFIGDLRPNSFTVRLDQISNGSRVTVQFTDKVTVKTVSSNGKWVMILGERPVEPLEQSYPFRDPYVSELKFDDQDGMPKLILTPAVSGLNFYPAMAEGGKILLADVLKPPPAVAEQGAPGQPASGQAAAPQAPVAEESPAVPPGPPLPLVVLDAAHGGGDRGARSRDGIAEKDLVAQLVARVRLDLLATKKYRIAMTRVGDVNVTEEQRDLAANLSRATAFFTFHAGNLGGSVPHIVVYTYQVPSPRAPTGRGEPPPKIFLPWNRAQQVHLERSRQLAAALQQKLAAAQGLTVDEPRRAEAPVRALRSVDAPAVAIEIGSLSPETDGVALTSPEFQQRISNAIVEALEAFRGGRT